MPLEITPDTRYIGRRRSVWYRANLGPIEATESTKIGARDKLMSTIEDAISGSFEPAMFAYGDGRILVYRDMMGWNYRYWEGVTAFSPDGYVMSCGSQDRDAAILSAKRYLAQAQYPRNGLDLLAGELEAIQTHCHWLGFQRAYEQARKNGTYTDNECHRFACLEADNVSRWLTADERAILDAATKVTAP